jgi:transcription initiation factor TFIIIB Brf1 subunit/transcription initiation factor TFIIB
LLSWRAAVLFVQVAACCLYIICRQESKPFMLIDLSDLLQVSRMLDKFAACARARASRAGRERPLTL